MLSLNPPLSDLIAEATTGLLRCFGIRPFLAAAAPGRVNLIGEHIDYCDGLVLPFAIDRQTVIAATLNGTNEARIVSNLNGEMAILPTNHLQVAGHPSWSNYLRGVLHGFQERGHVIPGFNAYIVSSIPIGAGLSSSAALECAMATLLEELADTTLELRDKALLCQKAEHDFAGVPCGLMDQLTSVLGKTDHLIQIDCLTGASKLIPFENSDLTLLIADTQVRHHLADGRYAERRKNTEDALAILGKTSWREVTSSEIEKTWQKLGNPLNRRARHVVSEIARTHAAAHALTRRHFEALEPLMAESHQSLRNDFEVSCSELDLMVEITRSIGRCGGVIGTRMTGGGFGGCTVTLCESKRADAIAQILHDKYQAATGIEPQLFTSRPAEGARTVAS